MQSLAIIQSSIEPFHIPLKPFSIAGNFISERTGLYLNLTSDTGITVRSEASPLPGVSQETFKKARHDLEGIQSDLKNFKIPQDENSLMALLHKNSLIKNLCPSVRFAVESAVTMLAAKSLNLSLVQFLGGELSDASSAGLLQGSYDQVMADAKELVQGGTKIFKLKVGDRNIPLDVKKVNDLRNIIPQEGSLRLDANRTWSLREALLFVELAGLKQIEFIEEPLSDISKLNEFYQQTHMPVALDETLQLSRCGITAPGRCSPTLAQHEAVKAYILKPMILGFIGTLDWIRESKIWGKKAIISASFESNIGLEILENLAFLTGQVPGLGTKRFLSS